MYRICCKQYRSDDCTIINTDILCTIHSAQCWYLLAFMSKEIVVATFYRHPPVCVHKMYFENTDDGNVILTTQPLSSTSPCIRHFVDSTAISQLMLIRGCMNAIGEREKHLFDQLWLHDNLDNLIQEALWFWLDSFSTMGQKHNCDINYMSISDWRATFGCQVAIVWQ